MVGSAQGPSLHERYLASTVLWPIRLPHSHFSSLAVTLVGRYFPTGRAIRISHVHLAALTVCHALRPRRCPICLPINGIEDSAFGQCDILSHLKSRYNGAQSLQPYGLRPTISLSTLNLRRYRRRLKTRYRVCWVNTSPVALSATSNQAPRGAPHFTFVTSN